MKAIIALSCVAALGRFVSAGTPATLETTEPAAISSVKTVAQSIEARTLADCTGFSHSQHGPHNISTRRHVAVRFEGPRLMAILTRQTVQIGHQHPAFVTPYHVRETAANRMHRRFVDAATHGRRFELNVRVVPAAQKIAWLTYAVGNHLERYELSCR